MSNKKVYTITLNDGEDHDLRFDFNAIALAENLLHMSITEIITSLSLGINVRVLSILLLAGLRFENRKLREDQCRDLLDGLDISKIQEDVVKYLMFSMFGEDSELVSDMISEDVDIEEKVYQEMEESRPKKKTKRTQKVQTSPISKE